MQFLPRMSVLAWIAACVLALTSLSTAVQGQTPPDPKKASDSTKSVGDNKDSPGKKIPLDKFTMPPGGVVVLVEELKDVRGYFPRMVILTPESYQELMDRITQLEKLKSDRKATPFQCRMKAEVQGETVSIQAELYFQTDQPRTDVAIGFRGAALSDAKILPQYKGADWTAAAVELSNDGYMVQVEKPGAYQLVLETRVPLANTSTGDRTFELSLPAAAVTTLKLGLADAVKEVRWNKTNVEKPLAPATELKHWEMALGKVTQVHVAWKQPNVSIVSEPLRTARGQVIVRIDELETTTTAELTLTDLRGKAREWRLWLPAQAKVKVVSPTGLAHSWDSLNAFQHVLTLAAPSTDPIKLQISTTTPRRSAKIPIGPFSVLDAVTQEGTIEVRASLDFRRRSRFLYQASSGIVERDFVGNSSAPGAQANDVVYLFKYGSMPLPSKNSTLAAAIKAMAPPLEIEQRAIQGKVETKVEHDMHLRPTAQGWQTSATCKITLGSLDNSADYLDVQLPQVRADLWPLLLGPSAAGLPAALTWGAWSIGSQLPLEAQWVLANASVPAELQFPDPLAKLERRARIKWDKTQQKEITLALAGTYFMPAGIQKVRLELPYPIDTHDRGAKGTVEVGDTLELLTQDGGPEVPVPSKHSVTRTWERAPHYWDLAWRSFQPGFLAKITADVTLYSRYAHVKQQLIWDGADRPRSPTGKAAPLQLLVPPSAKGLKIIAGGKILAQDAGKQSVLVDTTNSTLNNELVLEYEFPLFASAEKTALSTFRVPIVWPEQATRVETKVRMWCLAGTQLTLAQTAEADLAWKEVPREIVSNRDALPVRVFVSEGSKPPLLLRLESASQALPSVVIDRVLVDVFVDDEGLEQYRARFLVTRLQDATVQIRMPLALASLNPHFLLNGKEISWQPRDSAGLVALVHVEPTADFADPSPGKPMILEVHYQLPRNHHTTAVSGLGAGMGEGLWQTTLLAPVFEGNVFMGQVRWQVSLPPTIMAITVRGNARVEHAWKWRGWLPGFAPALSSSDLERWLTGQNAAESGAEASLVSSASSLEPLSFIRVPRVSWFIVVSGLVLLAGLGVYAKSLSPGWWHSILIVILCGVAAAAWLWQGFLPALLYGAAPGLLIVLVLWLLQWLVHERYKRQLLYLPGFTRLNEGSSLLRASTKQPRREASTIDAPRAHVQDNSMPGAGAG